MTDHPHPGLVEEPQARFEGEPRPEPERIVFDATSSGWPRYTHQPSGKTCLRQPWMNQFQWGDAKANFFTDAMAGIPVVAESGAPFDWVHDRIADRPKPTQPDWFDDRVWYVDHIDGRFEIDETTAAELLDDLASGWRVLSAHRLTKHGKLVEWDYAEALAEWRRDRADDARDRAALRNMGRQP